MNISMGMRLFLRDQLSLILIYLAQLLVVTSVYWLHGSHQASISLYAGLLSVTLLIAHLAIRYMTNKDVYSCLAKPLDRAEEFVESGQQSPLTEGLRQLLRSQFHRYKTELHQLQQQIDAHTTFINQWVHQMKTPLSVMHLIVQDEDDRRFAAIGDELDRLKKGLDLVLYTARLERFEHDFHVEMLDLETVVRSVMSEQKRLFIRRKLFPKIEMEGTLPIRSDEKWLSFVLVQLVTNAVRYTAREQGSIRLRGSKQGKITILEVRDEGIGIPKGDLPRVFQPYFTGENGRNVQESTGMGLYLAKQICDKLGHRIEVESVAREGTVVRITFANLTIL